MATNKPEKMRVVLSLEREVWREFQANLNRYGLPKGSASYLVQQFMERINIEVEVTGVSPQLELFPTP